MTSNDSKLTGSNGVAKDETVGKINTTIASDTQGGASLPPTDNNAEVRTRRNQYLITTRRGSGLHPMQASDLTANALDTMEGVTVVKRLKPAGLSALSKMGGIGDVLVAEAMPEKGLELQRRANRDIIVEPNHYLIHLGVLPQVPFSQPLPLAAGSMIRIRVMSDDGNQLENAEVIAFTNTGNQAGTTDPSGLVTLKIFGTSSEAITALYVKPFANYWERWIVNPELNTEETNVIRLQALTSFSAAGFPGPKKPFIGWGQKLMGLDKISPIGTMTGQGVRIAIIDSGCDITHPALTHITKGLDLTSGNNPFLDTMGHGTHCAGIISGNGIDGIRGFAPGAEIHILKLFPGGQFDDLISALAYCVENQIDIANCSLGSDQTSEAVQQRVDQARQAGVALIVAAGNSSGAVQFPALLPSVLSVSAIGQTAEFPSNTYHAQTIAADPAPNGNGLFVANFTCKGPQIRVCGPGVAIISSVPNAGYAAWDGTSMATPHLTGMAALLVASDSEIAQAPRNAVRVDMIFQRLMVMARDLGFPSAYEGAGLPSILPADAQSESRVNGFQNAPQSMLYDANKIVSLVTQEVTSAVIRNLVARYGTSLGGGVPGVPF